MVEKLDRAATPPLGPKPQVARGDPRLGGRLQRATCAASGSQASPTPAAAARPGCKPITALDVWRRAYQLVADRQQRQLHRRPGRRAAARTAAAAAAPRPARRLAARRAGGGGDAATSPIGSNAIGLGSRGDQERRRDAARPTRTSPGSAPSASTSSSSPCRASWTSRGRASCGLPGGQHRLQPPRRLVPHGLDRLALHPVPAAARPRQPDLLRARRQDPQDDLAHREGEGEDPGRAGDPQAHLLVLARSARSSTSRRRCYSWNATNAYALGDANADNLRVGNVWFDIDRARSVGDLVRAQSRDQGVPWVNTIAADDHGRALYQDNSVVPHVTKAKIATCIPAGLPQLVYQAAGPDHPRRLGLELRLGQRPRRRPARDLRARAPADPAAAGLRPELQRLLLVHQPEAPADRVPLLIIGSENTELGLRTRYGSG